MIDQSLSLEENFTKCESRQECLDLLKEFNAPLLEIVSTNKRACKKRSGEIHQASLLPYHDEAKRWKHGDKVYFGKSDNRSGVSFNDRIRMHKYYDIKAGQWCRVWEYQSRKKIAWLCQPGKPLKFENVIDHGFTLTDLKHAEISRVEMDIRKKLQEQST